MFRFDFLSKAVDFRFVFLLKKTIFRLDFFPLKVYIYLFMKVWPPEVVLFFTGTRRYHNEAVDRPGIAGLEE